MSKQEQSWCASIDKLMQIKLLHIYLTLAHSLLLPYRNHRRNYAPNSICIE